jgi:hypothetical protein
MKAILSKSATGNLRSKILDPKYNTAELVLEVYLTPQEFADIVKKYDDREFQVDIKEIKV